jgi:hypothetical protein
VQFSGAPKLIGAIAGGGRGTAIGAVVGGGAGTGAQVWKNGSQVRIPPETRLDFRFEHPVEITYIPGQVLASPFDRRADFILTSHRQSPLNQVQPVGSLHEGAFGTSSFFCLLRLDNSGLHR